ncbi:MAG TPA: hypothetical protein VGQ37_19915 [Vicinamibacterales bacterium]|jgi:uncharacterized protein involved in exopolysaccharide biosynthesis|nr:hypothetical protein [Vicinamibacterales bacterium]
MSGTENNVPVRKRSRKLWWSCWILAGVLAGTALYRAEPRIYQSQTSILIIPQRVPEWIVRPTVTADLNERLNMITQQILSRTRLERIIQEFNLYEVQRRQMIMEDVIERMRFDISVNVARPVRDGDEVRSFSVSFDSINPQSAMRVTERLAALFVQENLEDRELLADQTDQFLKGQVDDLAKRLVDSDLKLLEMKRRGLSISPLIAEHEVLLATYKQMVAHSEASKLAINLERRQIGEQFKIIDGARLPEKPLSRRLFPYLALGALTGLGAGLVASLLLFVWRRGRPRSAAPAPT